MTEMPDWGLYLKIPGASFKNKRTKNTRHLNQFLWLGSSFILSLEILFNVFSIALELFYCNTTNKVN